MTNAPRSTALNQFAAAGYLEDAAAPVELSNPNRPLAYTELDRGQSKVDVCAEWLRSPDSDIAARHAGGCIVRNR